MDNTFNIYMERKVKDYPVLFPDRFDFTTKWKPSQLIGMEFEVEGNNLPRAEDLRYYWRTVADGSLRGESYEYVLRTPNSYDYLAKKSLPYLLRAMNKKSSKTNFSIRCSTHVHLNVQNLYGYQVMYIAALYYVFEHIFTSLLQEQRKGNLFCLGVNDCGGALAESLRSAASDSSDFLRFISNDHNKYSAVNLCTVRKFGSLEFRALHGTLDRGEILDWVSIILSLYARASATAPSEISHIVEDISMQGCAAFLKELLAKGPRSEVYDRIVKQVGGADRLNNLFYEGLNWIQPLFFGVEWGALSPRDIKESEKQDKPAAKRMHHLDIETTDEPIPLRRAPRALNPLRFDQFMMRVNGEQVQVDGRIRLTAGDIIDRDVRAQLAWRVNDELPQQAEETQLTDQIPIRENTRRQLRAIQEEDPF